MLGFEALKDTFWLARESHHDDLGLAIGPIKGQSLYFFHGSKSFKTIMGLKDSKCFSHGPKRRTSFRKVH